MITWNFEDGRTLEFDEESHIYLVDGQIVPSVTQVLGKRFGGKYDHVNRETLKRAADRGTRIHKAIEDFCRTGVTDQSKEVHNFHFLCEKNGLEIVENEVPVIISNLAAGRLDIVLKQGETYGLADIKTTSQLYKEYLAAQLNLYRIGYEQCYKRKIGALFGIHLREDKRKLVSIPINEALAWDILERSIE